MGGLCEERSMWGAVGGYVRGGLCGELWGGCVTGDLCGELSHRKGIFGEICI